MITTRLAGPPDLAAAAAVWRQANIARDKAPDAERITRVETKPAAKDALVVIAEENDHVVGMALAEPGCADDGAGSPLPELCHISMVFVHPDHWGKAIGAELLTAVAEAAEKGGYKMLQLWTGQSNERALRLYQRCGFNLTGRTKSLGAELVLQLARAV